MKSLLLYTSLSLPLCFVIGCFQKAPSTNATNTTASSDSTLVLLPVKVAGKWGFANASGQLVINPQFDNVEEFHEGRAAICIGKPCDWWDATTPDESRWGFIDTSGKVVVNPQYGSVGEYSEGLASFCSGDCGLKPTKPFSRGYIDLNGNLVIPAQFGIASKFSEGLAQVCIGKCQWESDSGYDGKFGFIDHTGHFVINPQYDNADDFKNGFAKIFIGKGKDVKSGYIDKAGKTIWQPSN